MSWIHHRLSWALLLSVLAHGSLLLAWPAPAGPVPEVLSVTLVHKPPPASGGDGRPANGHAAGAHRPAPVSRPVAASPAVTTLPVLASPAGTPSVDAGRAPEQPAVPAALPPAVTEPAAAEVPVVASPVGGSAAPVAPGAEPSGPVAAAPLPGGAGAVGGEVGGGGGAAAQDLYRSRLAAQARRLKRYPPLARERGWQGAVEVEVIDHGATPLFRVRRSSGHALLDQQALDLMAQAARLVVVPESLRRTGFRFVLPVEFRLDD